MKLSWRFRLWLLAPLVRHHDRLEQYFEAFTQELTTMSEALDKLAVSEAALATHVGNAVAFIAVQQQKIDGLTSENSALKDQIANAIDPAAVEAAAAQLDGLSSQIAGALPAQNPA